MFFYFLYFSYKPDADLRFSLLIEAAARDQGRHAKCAGESPFK